MKYSGVFEKTASKAYQRSLHPQRLKQEQLTPLQQQKEEQKVFALQNNLDPDKGYLNNILRASADGRDSIDKYEAWKKTAPDDFNYLVNKWVAQVDPRMRREEKIQNGSQEEAERAANLQRLQNEANISHTLERESENRKKGLREMELQMPKSSPKGLPCITAVPAGLF
ncbi:MAG: hypothetical protein LBT46_04035 [Planctomycetaceae bacterium]|jgi:D-alanyl-D-alanine carboxypeptidase|nr:hypothetical protein [Planctomycetaceae bacterium]